MTAPGAPGSIGNPATGPVVATARTVPLRVTVAMAGLVGILALACSQLLTPGWAALASCAVLAGSYASFALADRRQAGRRRAMSSALLLVVAVSAAAQAVGGAGGQPGLASFGPLLAALLVGVQIAQSLVLDSRRDLLVGLVVGLFMTVLAAGLSPGVVVALPLLVAWPTAVAAVALAHDMSETESVDAVAVRHRAPDARPAGGRRWLSVAATVAVSVTLGLAAFLVLPQPAGLSARSHLLGGLASDPSAVGPTQTRSSSYYTGGYLDLRVRGSLSDDPVLEVPVGSPSLWRSNTLDAYDGTGWQSSQPPQQIVQGGPVFTVPLADDDVVPPGVRTRTDTVRLRSGAATGVVVSPGPVTSVQAAAGRLFHLGAGLVLLDTVGPLSQYQVTSVPETTDPATLRAATGPDLRDQRWTQLPTSVPLRVRQLAASIVARAPSRYDAVAAVERYLRSNETYRLDSPVPAPGEDPVDDFLFNSRQGFCEQFASAEVVLLRSRGIPARLVSGFAGGDPSPAGFRVMKASDAHAWVEVWYPGVGWSSSDPTAGALPAPPAQPWLVGRVAAAVRSFVSTPAGRIGMAAAVVALALLAAGGTRLALAVRRRRSGRVAAAANRAPGPVLAAFLLLTESPAAPGPRRAPAQTLAEYGRRLPPRAGPALAVLEREVYGATPPAPEQARTAVRTFQDLLAEMTAADPPRR